MKNTKYFAEIDGLKGLGIIGIISYSYFPLILKSGFLGIDIFFLISGFLIGLIIFDELRTTGNFNFFYFFEKRFRRIFPPLIFLVSIITFISIYVFDPETLVKILQSSIASIFFVSNFLFHFSSIGYFSEIATFQPLLNTWSLSIVEEYYIFFPIFILIIFRLNLSKYLLLLILIFCLISLTFTLFIYEKHPSFNYLMIFSRAWEILFGSLIAYLMVFKNFRIENKIANLILPKIGIILILFSFVFFNEKMNFPNQYSLVPLIGSLMIIMSSNQSELTMRIISNKFFVYIGCLSYHLFLWHYPLYTILKFKFFYIKNIEIISLFITFAMSLISYYFIDKYSRNMNVKFKTIIYYCSILLILSLSISLYYIGNILNQKKENYSSIHKFLNINKYKNDHINYKVEYNYDNFNYKHKNVFIVGSSYADDLLNIFNYNVNLKRNFYFYTASRKNPTRNSYGYYQIKCFYEFLESEFKKTKCHNHDFTNHLEKQYRKSDFIIFNHNEVDQEYADLLKKIQPILIKDNKKFLVIISDIRIPFFSVFNRIDTFFYHHKGVPNKTNLGRLEKDIFRYSKNYDQKKISSFQRQLEKMQIRYETSLNLFCDKKKQSCPIITNQNEKIFEDYGHITNEGAKHLSINFNNFINKNF